MLIEPAPETPKEPEDAQKRATTFAFVKFILVHTFFIGFFVVCLAVYHPLRAYETFISVAVITSPIWYLISDFFNKSMLAMQSNVNTTKITLICYTGGIMLTVGLVYLMNGQFDESPEQQCEKIVASKHSETHKSSRSYYASIPACTDSSTSFLNIDETVDISVSFDTYQKLQPGQTKAIVIYKNGRYGIPWKVSNRIILTPSKPPQLAAYLAQFARELQDEDYLSGVAYFKGTNGTKDDAKAVMHFKQAAERGNAVAQHDLAYMYFNGLGDGVKTAAAFELIKQSAQGGYALAQDYLGVMYGDGKDGAPQDWLQSYYWIKLSADQGYPQAIQDMNYVRSHMTPQQIEDAEKLSLQASSSRGH